MDIPLIEYIASKGKPMIISVGMATPDEIQEAIDACYRMNSDKIVLLKCCSEYPAPWNDMKLGNIPDMRERFGVPQDNRLLGCLGRSEMERICVNENRKRLS